MEREENLPCGSVKAPLVLVQGVTAQLCYNSTQ